jgi:hypothetical protein
MNSSRRTAAAWIAASTALAGYGGCGRSDEAGQAARPSSSPAQAVMRFVRVAGAGGRDPQRRKLIQACHLLSPDIRAGVRFEASVRRSDVNCAAALQLYLFYPGDTSGLPNPSSFKATVTGTRAEGSRAIVSATLTYQTSERPRTFRSKVLTVRQHGGWWVATPSTLGILTASRGVDNAKAQSVYHTFRRQAGTAQSDYAQGQRASSRVHTTAQPCPKKAAAVKSDRTRDVVANDGRKPLPHAPASTDLVRVTSSPAEGSICFALTYAGQAPARAAVTLHLRPGRPGVTVQWDPEGKVVGEINQAQDDRDKAVAVSAARHGRDVFLRVPATAFGASERRYVWALESFVRMPKGQDSYYDSVPDDLTVSPDGGNHYVPSPSG